MFLSPLVRHRDARLVPLLIRLTKHVHEVAHAQVAAAHRSSGVFVFLVVTSTAASTAHGYPKAKEVPVLLGELLQNGGEY